MRRRWSVGRTLKASIQASSWSGSLRSTPSAWAAVNSDLAIPNCDGSPIAAMKSSVSDAAAWVSSRTVDEPEASWPVSSKKAAKVVSEAGMDPHSSAATLSLRGHHSSRNSATCSLRHHPRSPSA